VARRLRLSADHVGTTSPEHALDRKLYRREQQRAQHVTTAEPGLAPEVAGPGLAVIQHGAHYHFGR
jgi:hypothetical protein